MLCETLQVLGISLPNASDLHCRTDPRVVVWEGNIGSTIWRRKEGTSKFVTLTEEKVFQLNKPVFHMRNSDNCFGWSECKSWYSCLQQITLLIETWCSWTNFNMTDRNSPIKLSLSLPPLISFIFLYLSCANSFYLQTDMIYTWLLYEWCTARTVALVNLSILSGI